ncbi:hypothetical protein EIB18_15140 [Caulobacter vibrioides]|uniref:Uncharacterized protein n=2 Tax=Caulobacter vibrioides TaxID=155892 RepID=Q9A4H7_CAUVC|nr:hypothetical protein [Caulobacter vibrioides]YP_002518321.1 hypothetical protein CCNA_02948 [Caulobacter vibrioides NA1000]AAK24819.1 hypothetical protein CC_2855 [Caulobacter vibrioides CB15]ACL96413.1 hypothetical protein CCNA_02948 [Caulobacter vibrioides NA1000]ATC29688.1 hypothetical protein CA607_15390 [Caulobacter vibrioides]AZH13904.1 hypothetical protein EIB18_15140 [Caulobacter vibrioides]QXZ51209.1 hypothetical protein KZH45_15160 [Caulobacter vibrioides]
MSAANTDYDHVFGARLHDLAYWAGHTLVDAYEGAFEDGQGWVGLKFNRTSILTLPRVAAEPSQDAALVRAADLYFWGEGDCPMSVFETAPAVDRLLFWVEGPIEDDHRTWWCVGLWLKKRP